MGSYNSQYENYYNGMLNKKKGYNNHSYGNGVKLSSGINKSFLVRRICTDLIGTLVLIFFVLICKLIVTPQTAAVYNYSKELLNKNYDYSYILGKVKSFNIQDAKQKSTDFIDNIKAKVSGADTVKAKISNNFVMPVNGNIASKFGERTDPITNNKEFNSGIDIYVSEGTDVKASFDGRIKDCGEDAVLGKYILIDHGSGIETKYGHLKDISVKKEDRVKREDVIGKSGNIGKSSAPQLHFELLYMGENKDPLDYFKSTN